MVKVKKSEVVSLHAAVDELAAANPELFSALNIIITNMLSAETAVSVPAKSAGKKGGKVAANIVEDEEDDDDTDGSDDGDMVDGDDDEEEEDELAPAPKGKGKAAAKPATKTPAKAATPAKASGKPKKAAVVEEPEEEEEADVADLEALDSDSIETWFANFEPETLHEKTDEVGIRELSATIDELGFDVKSIATEAKATTTSAKRSAYASFLTRVYATLDKINEFELASILEAIHEYEGHEEFKPAGKSAAAKELSAATMLFKLVFDLVSED